MSRRVCFTQTACFLLAILPLGSAWARKRVPADTPIQEWDEQDLKEYTLGLLTVTLFGGLLLWVIWELLQLGFCCYCCFSKKDRKFENKRPRIEKMYSYSQTITDKLLEKTSGERGFYIGAGVLSLGFIACVMALWRYSTNFETSSMDVYDGIHTFTVDFAGFLCSKDQEFDCDSFTIGGYLRDAEQEAEHTFDSVYEYLGELSTLAQGLDDAITSATDALDALDDMEQTSNNINDNVDEADDLIQDIKQQYPYLADEMPDDIDPNADWNIVTQSLISVTNAQLHSVNVQDDLADFYIDAIEELRARIDGDSSTGATDDRLKLNDFIDRLVEDIRDVRDRVLRGADNLEEGRPFIEDSVFFSKLILSIFFAVPVIVLGSTSLCKSKTQRMWPLYSNLSFICICQLIFCVFTGAVMIVAILLDDICVTHMDVIRTTAGDYSFVVGDSTVYLADSVEGLLKCGHNKHSDVAPNIAAILTIDDEFNVTEYTDPVIVDLYEIKDHILEQTLELQDALEEMDDVYDAFDDFDVHILNYNNKARKGIKDCDELLDALPSTDMANNRSDAAEQAKVEAWFPFDFDTYVAAVDELNLELAKMSYIPAPFDDQLTPDSVQWLTPAALESEDWEDADDSGTCDAGTSNCANYSSTNYTTIKGLADSVYTTFTVPLNNILAENNGAIVMINDLRALLIAIEDDIDLIDQQEDVVLAASDGVTEGVSQMMDDINLVVENVTTQIELINNIVDFIATSPDYLGCEWIGRLYVETWQEDFCEGSVGAMNDSYGPMLTVTLLMMLTFALTAIYIPVIKRERRRKAAEDALNCGCDLEPKLPPPKFMVPDMVSEKEDDDNGMELPVVRRSEPQDVV